MSVSGVYELPGASLYYEQEGEGLRITRFHGAAGLAEVPPYIEGLPVRAIGAKAFLSCKNIRRVRLPETVEEIGDWAFGYCDNLERVTLPAGDVRFGRAPFLDCKRLRFLETNGGGEGTAALLAAAVTVMDAGYLLDAAEAGSGEWLAKWDARMLALLNQPDQEGYSRQVLCGEEDYGSTDLDAYLRERRKKKVRLLLLRLRYPEGLSGEHRECVRRYLYDHRRGGSSPETWLVLWQEYGADSAYRKLFAELGCIRQDNLDGMLTDLGADEPELSAFLLRYRQESGWEDDFFGGLEL